MPTFDPKIELYGDNHTLDFPGFQGNDADIISRMWNEWYARRLKEANEYKAEMWNEWYDRRLKEAKKYIKCRHKAEIANAASQYEL